MSRIRRRRSIVLRVSLTWAVLVSCAATVRAQGDDPMQALGVVPEHGAISFFPWEHIDLYTGNAVLSFADIVLPGNAGFNLVVTRTYNTKDNTWVWGVAPMIEYPGDFGVYPYGDPAYDHFPQLRQPDGNVVHLFRTDGRKRFRTSSFWLYDAETRILRTPDGVVYQYDEDDNLTEMHDAFGNSITVAVVGFNPQQVVQHLGDGQTRTVIFHYDQDNLLTSIEYGNRQWQYVWGPMNDDPNPPDPRIFLREVIPPAGGHCKFVYGRQYLDHDPIARAWRHTITVTTPNDGTVEYESREYIDAPGGNDRNWDGRKLLYRRTRARAVVGG